MQLLRDFGGLQHDLLAHSKEIKKVTSNETHCMSFYVNLYVLWSRRVERLVCSVSSVF
jgi:hypothetical protein